MVKSTILDVLRKKWEEIGSTADVTLRTLSLAVTADATTGWYAKTFTESTIHAYIVERGLQQFVLPPGYYTNYDAVAFSRTALVEGDELEDQNNNFYRIEAVKHHGVLDKGLFYEAQLSRMPLHPERAAESSPTKLTGRNNFFAQLLSHYKRMMPGTSPDVTLYALSLGSQDGETGWYEPSWTQSTIEMVIVPA